MNHVPTDDNEHGENSEQNKLCPDSAKMKNTENIPGLENSWNIPADMSKRENAVDPEDDTERKGMKELNPPNKFEPLTRNMNNSISTIRLEVKDNRIIRVNGRKNVKEAASSDSEKEYIRKLPKTMTVDLSRKGIWALGTEVTLDTNGENEGFEVDME